MRAAGGEGGSVDSRRSRNHQLVLLVETKGSKPAKGLRNAYFSI